MGKIVPIEPRLKYENYSLGISAPGNQFIESQAEEIKTKLSSIFISEILIGNLCTIKNEINARSHMPICQANTRVAIHLEGTIAEEIEKLLKSWGYPAFNKRLAFKNSNGPETMVKSECVSIFGP